MIWNAGLQLALAGGYQEHVARGLYEPLSTAVICRMYDRAMGYLNNGIAYCDEHDLDSWRLYMLAFRARARFEQIDWHGASEDAEVVLRDPRTAAVSRVSALTVLGHMRIRRGDPDPGGPLEEARTLASKSGESQRIGRLHRRLRKKPGSLGTGNA